MRVLVLGGDGYLGWPTAMALANRGFEVRAVDNYMRRLMALQTQSQALIPTPDLHQRALIFQQHFHQSIAVDIGDCADYGFLSEIFRQFKPHAVIHYAEQPSAPYSMLGRNEARHTLLNNIGVTFNVIWSILEHCPDCHLIKLGTMGEYGTPNIDIEEGWLEVEHNGRRHRFLYPRQAGSLYHTTKVLDTDLLWFYVRMYDLRVTDLMQGPVYGMSTEEADDDERLLPNFHYDDIFGTVVNRFLVQAVAGYPLTVYGLGEQIRGYLNLKDTLQCVQLAVEKPASVGELRILNQLTETFSVNQLAEAMRRVGNSLGLQVTIQSISNPRKEMEEHYYNPKHSGLLDLGMKPHFMTDEVIAEMLQLVGRYKDKVNKEIILPRVRWQ